MNERKETADESAIRALIEDWAAAVRANDIARVLAHHCADMLMFDVPPPLESRGIDAYRDTWDLFYSASPVPVAFDIQRLDVVAGADVAFAMAQMQCALKGQGAERIQLEFRLTVGLRKRDGAWTIVHEHHSVPAQ